MLENTCVPTCEIHQGADRNIGAYSPANIAEQACEARGRTGGLLGYKIKRVYTYEHDRAVNQKSDCNQHRHINAWPTWRVKPVDQNTYQR